MSLDIKNFATVSLAKSVELTNEVILLSSIAALRRTSIGRAFEILTVSDQRKLIRVAIIQILLSFLDLLGVLAVGLLGAISVSGLGSGNPGARTTTILTFLHISELKFQLQVLILATSSVLLLVGRTLLSIYFTRRILYFLSRRGAITSANLIARLLSQPLLLLQSRSMQEMVYSVTRGVQLIVLEVLATSIVLVADFSLLLILMIGLFFVDPIISIGSILIFGSIGLILYRLMNVHAAKLGIRSSELNIESNQKIVEVFSSYREALVRNRRDYYAREIGKLRYDLADTSAEITFLPYVSKYVFETAVILGAVLIGGLQFFLQNATHAIATLSIFLVAGTRIAPSVLRVQQGLISIRGSLGQAKPTLDLLSRLGSPKIFESVEDTVNTSHKNFDATLDIKNVSLTFPGKDNPAISEISFSIPSGASVAIVGSSGAGKTTLIDVLLGVLPPDLGSVTISGLAPLDAVSKWPGAIAYVPQDVLIASGSVRENVALGFPPGAATDLLVSNALRVAHLLDFVDELPEGLDTQVGERGTKISGGQRQRLGIARAMFTQPLLLVLDEATSSLDGQTEALISKSMTGLRGSTTVVMIAHRLSTVRNADIVIYLSEGKVLAKGTFDEVREAIPNFDQQAKLMGL